MKRAIPKKIQMRKKDINLDENEHYSIYLQSWNKISQVSYVTSFVSQKSRLNIDSFSLNESHQFLKCNLNDKIIHFTTWKVSVFRVFLIRIFPHSDWIWRGTENLFLFSANAGKYEPEKLQIWTLFKQCLVVYASANWTFVSQKSRLNIDSFSLNESHQFLKRNLNDTIIHFTNENCPYSEFFWSAFSRIRTEHGETRTIHSERRKIRTRKTPNQSLFVNCFVVYASANWILDLIAQ